MKFQPNRDYVSNDDIQTPPELAARLVAHFRPAGIILEPCAGDGHFLPSLPGALWCEIKRGRDFLAFREPVDWIITNPPWSQIRPFLKHSFSLARDVAFLMTVNHAWTKGRLRVMAAQDFGLREIALVPTPPSFPQSGSNSAWFTTGATGPATSASPGSPDTRPRPSRGAAAKKNRAARSRPRAAGPPRRRRDAARSCAGSTAHSPSAQTKPVIAVTGLVSVKAGTGCPETGSEPRISIVV